MEDDAFGAASPVVPKFISHSDPASQWTGARRGPAYFAYSTNYLIADTAYLSGPMLDWLVEKCGIAPHIPVIDKSGRNDGTFERVDFTYDAKNDLYTCPGGVELKHNRRAFKTLRSSVNKDETIRYRARKSDCDACALKERCCPKEPQRKVTRSIYEKSRDVAHVLSKTLQYSISRKLRKKVKMSFAHLKHIRGLRRLRLRGPCGAHGEVLLAATAQNLKKIAKLVPNRNLVRRTV